MFEWSGCFCCDRQEIRHIPFSKRVDMKYIYIYLKMKRYNYWLMDENKRDFEIGIQVIPAVQLNLSTNVDSFTCRSEPFAGGTGRGKNNRNRHTSEISSTLS